VTEAVAEAVAERRRWRRRPHAGGRLAGGRRPPQHCVVDGDTRRHVLQKLLRHSHQQQLWQPSYKNLKIIK